MSATVGVFRTLSGNFEAVMFIGDLYTRRVDPLGKWAKFPNADTMKATIDSEEDNSYLKAWACINACLSDNRESAWFIGIEDFYTMAAEIDKDRIQ